MSFNYNLFFLACLVGNLIWRLLPDCWDYDQMQTFPNFGNRSKKKRNTKTMFEEQHVRKSKWFFRSQCKSKSKRGKVCCKMWSDPVWGRAGRTSAGGGRIWMGFPTRVGVKWGWPPLFAALCSLSLLFSLTSHHHLESFFFSKEEEECLVLKLLSFYFLAHVCEEENEITAFSYALLESIILIHGPIRTYVSAYLGSHSVRPARRFARNMIRFWWNFATIHFVFLHL